MAAQKKQRRTTIVILMALTVSMLFLFFNLMDSQASMAAQLMAPATIETNWHTFLGAASGYSGEDLGTDVAVDSYGYAYVVGQSIGQWGGTVIISHSLSYEDGFLAKVDNEGTLLWHTFIGGSESDSAQAITVDDVDNLFVVGTSNGGDWNTMPITDNHGARDAFVAKLNTNGDRQWFTFVGLNSNEWGDAIAVDATGNIYVGGTSEVNPYLAKLDSDGEFQWQRVITSTSGGDLGSVYGAATDEDGDVYLTGVSSYSDWHGAPSPVRPHTGYPGTSDAFVAKFDGASGVLLWHTFLGAADWSDEGHTIVVQTTSSSTPTVYIAGWSGDSWGSPVHAHTGSTDGFVAQLNGEDGTLIWNTFMGNETYGDEIHALAIDDEARLFVAGDSREGWGRPMISHPQGIQGDASFVAALSADGDFLGNTFLGGAPSSDTASGIAISTQGAIYVAGSSSADWANLQWGNPVRAFSDNEDAFVAGLGVQSVIRYWIYTPVILRQ